ncbi:MAG: radical SAM protein [Holophagales bacterium]|nr:radical SAM protein [Holophagales bacterium]
MTVARSDQPVATGDEGPDCLVLFYTERCNIACRHCIVDSGPQRRGRMPLARARQALESAAACGAHRVVLSGGETLLFLEDTLQLCQHARRLGLSLRLFTNGFWGADAARARSILQQLADAGLDELVLSLDRFHRHELPAARLRPLLTSLCLETLPRPFTWLQVVVPPGPHETEPGATWPTAVSEELAAYGLDLDQVVPLAAVSSESPPIGRLALQWLPAFRGGRALRNLSPAPEVPLSELRGACPAAGRQLTVRPGGHVYPCCSSWTNHPRHCLQAPSESFDLGSLARRAAADPVVRVVHDEGPGALLRRLRREGETVPETYSDICHACHEMFSRFSPSRLAEAARAQRESTFLTWLLEASTEPAPPGQPAPGSP